MFLVYVKAKPCFNLIYYKRILTYGTDYFKISAKLYALCCIRLRTPNVNIFILSFSKISYLSFYTEALYKHIIYTLSIQALYIYIRIKF